MRATLRLLTAGCALPLLIKQCPGSQPRREDRKPEQDRYLASAFVDQCSRSYGRSCFGWMDGRSCFGWMGGAPQPFLLPPPPPPPAEGCCCC